MMQTNGGVAPAARARELPIALPPGPGGRRDRWARQQSWSARAPLTFDMGGTTADIGLVIDGSPCAASPRGRRYAHQPAPDRRALHRLRRRVDRPRRPVPLATVGRPAPAPSQPAAYGLGGEDATVTDAHVVLGNLSAESALADGVPLDRELAERAVAAAVGEPLGLGVEEAAVAILRIANANMANALRVMTIARGHDPRRFALVAIGGAGPMHACALADELGIPRVVIPRYPGVAAALGLLATDIRHDLRRSWLQPTAAITPADLDAEFARLEVEAGELLETSASVTRSFEFSHELDMRYRGQAYNLTVPFAPRPVTAETIAAAEAAFEEEHRRLYDYTPTVTETDIVTLRLRALARIPDIDWTVVEDSERAAVAGTRRVYHGGWREWTAAGRAALAQDDTIAAEPIIEQEDTTVVIHPVGADASARRVPWCCEAD
jgi:N-methylhydantoinase A